MKWSLAYNFNQDQNLTIGEAMQRREKYGRNDPRAGDLWCHKKCYISKEGSQLLTNKGQTDSKSGKIKIKPHFKRWKRSHTSTGKFCGLESLASSKRESMDYANFYLEMEAYLNGLDKNLEPFFIQSVSSTKESQHDFEIIHSQEILDSVLKSKIYIIDENKRKAKIRTRSIIEDNVFIIVIKISEYTPEDLVDFQRGGVDKFLIEWNYLKQLGETKAIKQESKAVTQRLWRLPKDRKIIDEMIANFKQCNTPEFIAELRKPPKLYFEREKRVRIISNRHLLFFLLIHRHRPSWDDDERWNGSHKSMHHDNYRNLRSRLRSYERFGHKSHYKSNKIMVPTDDMSQKNQLMIGFLRDHTIIQDLDEICVFLMANVNLEEEYIDPKEYSQLRRYFDDVASIFANYVTITSPEHELYDLINDTTTLDREKLTSVWGLYQYMRSDTKITHHLIKSEAVDGLFKAMKRITNRLDRFVRELYTKIKNEWLENNPGLVEREDQILLDEIKLYYYRIDNLSGRNAGPIAENIAIKIKGVKAKLNQPCYLRLNSKMRDIGYSLKLEETGKYADL
ncbi:hypothetical protein N9X72_00045 [Candidatus Poseidoniales archaeon]|nr:hypothetical protein [Candidatus Poseidoniales archaeon]